MNLKAKSPPKMLTKKSEKLIMVCAAMVLAQAIAPVAVVHVAGLGTEIIYRAGSSHFL